MVVVTTWCVKTNLANPIFVGYVWDLGNRMDLHGMLIRLSLYYPFCNSNQKPRPCGLYNAEALIHFCWYSRYNCNRYDEDEARLAREGQEKSRSALQRYLFYCNRYMNHLQSLKFENKLYSMVKVSTLGTQLFVRI